VEIVFVGIRLCDRLTYALGPARGTAEPRQANLCRTCWPSARTRRLVRPERSCHPIPALCRSLVMAPWRDRYHGYQTRHKLSDDADDWAVV